MGEKVTDEELTDIIREVDADMDGRVSGNANAHTGPGYQWLVGSHRTIAVFFFVGFESPTPNVPY